MSGDDYWQAAARNQEDGRLEATEEAGGCVCVWVSLFLLICIHLFLSPSPSSHHHQVPAAPHLFSELPHPLTAKKRVCVWVCKRNGDECVCVWVPSWSINTLSLVIASSPHICVMASVCGRVLLPRASVCVCLCVCEDTPQRRSSISAISTNLLLIVFPGKHLHQHKTAIIGRS